MFGWLHDGDHVALGFSDGCPTVLLEKLAEHVQHTGIRLKIHYMHGGPGLWALASLARSGQIELRCYFMGAVDRKLVEQGVPVRCVPAVFRDVGRLMLEAGVRGLLVTGAVRYGRLSFGTSYGYESYVGHRVRVLTEDNVAMPFIESVDNLQTGKPNVVVDVPLARHRFPEPTEIERAIAGHILALLPREPVLQVGVGGVPNGVLIGLLEEKRKLTGIHSELFCPGMVPLLREGLVHKVSATLALGDSDSFFDYLPKVSMRAVEFTNDLGILAATRKLVSINGAMEVDLAGQVNSEQNGWCRQYSGTGGQLDFVLGATASSAGMSFLCMPSTRVLRKTGEIRSRLVEHLHGAVTVPRTCVDWIVTEKGARRLRGQTADRRSELLREIF